MNLDLRDKKLLTYLDENSRTPESELAKKLQISRQAIKNRIDMLVKKRIIKKFIAIIDPTKFVDNIWHIYLKLQNMTVEKEQAVIRHLNNSDQIWWIALCQGEWDIIFSYAGKDVFEFDKELQKFNTEFSSLITNLEVTTFIKSEMFSRAYFINQVRKSKKYVSNRFKPEISENEKSILKQLAENSRINATDICKKTKLTLRQVLYSITQLSKDEIIRAYRLQIDLEKIGYDYYKVCFYTQSFTEQIENKIIYWCSNNPYTLFYVRKIAPWTFEIEFEMPSYKTLNETLKDLRNQFGTIIKKTETTMITKEYKGELNILKTVGINSEK